MSTRVTDLFLSGAHGSIPAAGSTPVGALYACSTHNLIYKNDGSTWPTWASLLGSIDAEAVRDTIGATLVAGAGITVTVNDGSDTIAIDNTGATTRSINAQTGTSYTLVSGDAGKFVTMSNASASTLTVPLNASVAYATGTIIEGAQLGAGQVTLAPTGGVTLNGSPGLKVAAQYGTFGLLKTATDTWLAYGRLSA